MARLERRISLKFACLAALVLGLAVEGSARLAFAYKARLVALLPVRKPQLHDYQERDPTHPASWRLKAGFVRTFAQAMSEKQRGDNPPGDIFVRINADGFRGPEIDRSRPHPRILALGDSCTFGMIERFSYPRVLERELRQRGQVDVEVVNGGVEGYSPRDVLYQMDRYRTLRPVITLVYIGWGSLYNETHALDTQPSWARLDSLHLLARSATLVAAAVQDPKARPEQASLEPKHPDQTAPEIRRLDAFVPTFLADVEEIVTAMRSAGSRVVLLTLPGLYTFDSPLTAKALRIGDLPAFTDNPYVLAKMGERYNAELRKLAGREGLQLIDLDEWSRSALIPRDEHFVNAVHLDEAAQEMAGRYIAAELAPTLAALETSRAVSLQR